MLLHHVSYSDRLHYIRTICIANRHGNSSIPETIVLQGYKYDKGGAGKACVKDKKYIMKKFTTVKYYSQIMTM